MRILHTSDWHLGKYLENFSRLEEQSLFLQQLNEIVEENEVELIVIAGDIYDTANPPAEAEQIFFQSIKKLCNEGKRPVIIISGNHDSPSRLTASSPIAIPQGIIVFGTPNCVIPKCEYEHFSIVNSGQGFIELFLNGEKVLISAMPYPSEKRLNDTLINTDNEKELQKNYSEKIGYLFKEIEKEYREDTINICIAHLYVIGGEMCKSERDISLGGSYAVSADVLPKAQYIAMGHLHRPQKVSGCENAFYSGSPIQYSKSEEGYAKCVYMVDVVPSKPAEVNKVYLKNYKPIVILKASSIEEAIQLCEKYSNENCYLYLEITTDRAILQDEIKTMRTLKKDIVDICPFLIDENYIQEEEIQEKTILEQFNDFYFENKKILPTDELRQLFLELVEDTR